MTLEVIHSLCAVFVVSQRLTEVKFLDYVLVADEKVELEVPGEPFLPPLQPDPQQVIAVPLIPKALGLLYREVPTFRV